MINIYTIEGCSRCKTLIEELNKQGLEYIDRDADIYEGICNRLERMLGTTMYPIIHINGKLVNIYIVDKGAVPTIESHKFTIVKQYDSIVEIIHLIKEQL